MEEEKYSRMRKYHAQHMEEPPSPKKPNNDNRVKYIFWGVILFGIIIVVFATLSTSGGTKDSSADKDNSIKTEKKTSKKFVEVSNDDSSTFADNENNDEVETAHPHYYSQKQTNNNQAGTDEDYQVGIPKHEQNDSPTNENNNAVNTDGTFGSVSEAVAWGRQQVANNKCNNFKVINDNGRYRVILQ